MNVEPATDKMIHRKPGRSKLVILIHGIRTEAAWHQVVRRILEEQTDVTVVPLKYAYFNVFQFVCPFFTRRAVIQTLEWKLRAALDHYPESDLIIVAHSFGTYAISEILRHHPDIKPQGLLLCGSIIPAQFRWDQLRIKASVLNECGYKDIWPVLATALTWGFGPSGTTGFGSPGVRDRFHPCTHSEFFSETFVRENWVPWIRGGCCNERLVDNHAPSVPWVWSILAAMPFKWVVLALVLLIPLFYKRISTEIRVPTSTADAVGHVISTYKQLSSYQDRSELLVRLSLSESTHLDLRGECDFAFQKPCGVSMRLKLHYPNDSVWALFQVLTPTVHRVNETATFSITANDKSAILYYHEGGQYMVFSTSTCLEVLGDRPNADITKHIFVALFKSYSFLTENAVELRRRIAPGEGYRSRADHDGKLKLNWIYRFLGPENGVGASVVARAPNDIQVGILVDGWKIMKEEADLAPLFRAAGAKEDSQQLVGLLQQFAILKSANCEITHTNILLNAKLDAELFRPERPPNAVEVTSFEFIP